MHGVEPGAHVNGSQLPPTHVSQWAHAGMHSLG
jgi:hypothetical protein